MSRVACVGIAVHDIVFRVDRLPYLPGKYRAGARQEVGGGVAANAAVTVARLGGTASFHGPVGDDETGDRILLDLAAAGVEVADAPRAAGQASPLSAVLVDGAGERLIVNHAGADLFTEATLNDTTALAEADAVLTDMRWPRGAIPALRTATAAGIAAIVDCDHDPADAPGILEEATHIVFALGTLLRYSGSEDVAAALRVAAGETGAWVAATAGRDGVYWLEDDGLAHGPADRVETVDTLGAGDVFHGAFALAVAEGRALRDALRWGSAAAALKCTRFGGRAGIPMRNDVDRFVEARGPWT